MAGRILGGSCGNVRLFSVPSSSSSFSFYFSLSLRSLAVLPFFFFSSLASLFSPFGPARRFVPPSHPPPFVPFSLLSRARSSSSRLAAFGYHLGHRGHPPRCTRYVVCPIFTHGKSTLKRRWTFVRSSFLSSPSVTALLLSCIAAASQ